MLLSSLTPDEIERLAYIAPDRLDVARAHAAICRNEVERCANEISALEQHVTELEDYDYSADE